MVPDRIELDPRKPITSKFIDMTGWEHNGIVVTSFAGWRKTWAVWNCKCRCGNKFRHYGAILRQWKNKRTNSPICPCRSTRPKKKPREYHVWRRMVLRYGDEVCAKWRKSFKAFYRDMGEAPKGTGCVGRNNVSEPFCKLNCVWCDHAVACKLSLQRLFTYQGKTLNITQWAAVVGVSKERMRQRFNRFSVGRAITYRVPKGEENVKKQKRLAKYVAFDSMIDTCLASPGAAQLFKRGKDFECSTESARQRVVTTARIRGANLTTRMNDEQSFWAICFPES